MCRKKLTKGEKQGEEEREQEKKSDFDIMDDEIVEEQEQEKQLSAQLKSLNLSTSSEMPFAEDTFLARKLSPESSKVFNNPEISVTKSSTINYFCIILKIEC
jgi:glutathione synthase/RimK-type ligase-like ATP-grasp enzyme